MKTMKFFEPAMCCPTGLCGVGVDPELLRISTTLNTLKQNGIEVQRFNLSTAPQEFVNNKVINEFLKQFGADKLPAVVVDDTIVITGRYPSNEEFIELLDIPSSLLSSQHSEEKSSAKCCDSEGAVSNECCCEGDNSNHCCCEGESSNQCCSENQTSDECCCK